MPSLLYCQLCQKVALMQRGRGCTPLHGCLLRLLLLLSQDQVIARGQPLQAGQLHPAA